MKIAIIIAAALLLILLLPIAARISYDGAFSIKIGLLAPFWKIYPLKPKKEKSKKKRGPKKNKKAQKQADQEKKAKPKLDRALIFGLLKKFPVYFKRLLVIREIYLDAVIGNEDPADLALAYGAVQAGLSSASAVLHALYPVEKWKVRVEADFEKAENEIEGRIAMHTNLLRILAVLISFGIYVILNDSNEKEQ